MDKIAFNNEIVLMRHAVRKARVAIVSKLTKEVRLLNARKHGNENMIIKCKRKADKLLKEMKILRKLKDDDVSKFAIINTRNIQDVLTDLNADVKTRMMIRLAFHKTLKAKVDQFKETFKDYQTYFDSEKKTKVKSTKQNRREVKVNNNENVVEQLDDTKKDISDVTTIAASSCVFEEGPCDSDSHRQDDSFSKSKKNRQTTSKVLIGKEKNNNKDEIAEHVDKDLASVTFNHESRKHSIVKVVSKLAAVKRFNVTDDVMENIGTEEAIADDAEFKEDMVQDDRHIDPFSITEMANNNNIRLTLRPSNTSNDVDHDVDNFNSSSGHYNSRKFFTNMENKKSVRNYEFERKGPNRRNTFTHSTDKQSYNNQSDRTKKNSRVENSRTQQTNIDINTSNGDLHPSWAARKKQQDIIKQGFQGKKIIFNDD